MGGYSLRPRKVRAQPLAPRVPGPPHPLRLLLLKRRQGKERNTSLPSVTSETMSPPEEKKKKVISESPDSQAEGPFYDMDTTSVHEDSPHAL